MGVGYVMADIATFFAFAAVFVGAVTAIIFGIASNHPAPSRTLLIPAFIAGVLSTGVFFVASVLFFIAALVT